MCVSREIFVGLFSIDGRMVCVKLSNLVCMFIGARIIMIIIIRVIQAKIVGRRRIASVGFLIKWQVSELKCELTSQSLLPSALCGHWVPFRRQTKSDSL